MKNELTKLFVELVLKDEGLLEVSKNRHPDIDLFNKYTHVPLGSPYCLSALLYRLNEACNQMGIINPITPQASTQTFFNNAPLKYVFHPTAIANVGEIGIMQSRKNPVLGHAFMVTKTKSPTDELVNTAEYNTGPSGSRDGEGFYLKHRDVNGNSLLKMRGYVDVVSWVLGI